MKMKPILVMLADDHPIVRATVYEQLNREPDIRVVVEVGQGEKVVPVATTTHFDLNVLVLDLSMPNLKVSDAIRQIKVSRPDLHILILSAHVDKILVETLLEAGASGYVSKSDALNTVVTGVRAVNQGEKWLSPEVSRIAFPGDMGKSSNLLETLSVREQEVLQLIGQGLDNQAIATKLGITKRTAKFHVSNIFTKLGVSSRMEAILTILNRAMVDL